MPRATPPGRAGSPLARALLVLLLAALAVAAPVVGANRLVPSALADGARVPAAPTASSLARSFDVLSSGVVEARDASTPTAGPAPSLTATAGPTLSPTPTATPSNPVGTASLASRVPPLLVVAVAVAAIGAVVTATIVAFRRP